jgi:hypothetical protein
MLIAFVSLQELRAQIWALDLMRGIFDSAVKSIECLNALWMGHNKILANGTDYVCVLVLKTRKLEAWQAI